ncbi:hypothetical protein C3486_21260 [Streptomyces sp. Ru73]|uniref:MAB_1171c family putative transporter n=1 Tax=Streptomyces sp. Ru73 TaxID=2080748 RepID=UPI000CDCFAB5|nr:MAB_1171c family putative transporter [Streptomyces sp. Ru73]POX38811.1 hypothetical protein C3486_21260 [Streptomyces sp. Ru73]
MADAGPYLRVLYVVLFHSAALTSAVITAGKLLALRHDRSPALVVIASGSVLATAAFVTTLLPVHRWIGSLTGLTGLDTLVIQLCVHGFAAHSHILAALWGRESLPDRRLGASPRALAVLYLVIAAVLTALYFSADLPDSPAVASGAGLARDPAALAFLLLSCAAGAYALLSTARACRQIHRVVGTGRPPMSRALRAIGWGSLLIVVSHLLRVLPLLTAAVTHRHPDVLRLVAPLAAGVGCHLVQYGYLAPAWSAWRRERRDFRRLRSLWDLTVRSCEPHLALHPPGRLTEGLALNVRSWYLPRRVMEIADALRTLHPWMSPEPAERVRLAASGLMPSSEVAAVCAAATLADAASRKRRGLPAHPRHGSCPVPGLPAGDERAYLVRVAAALEHPLVTGTATGRESTGTR